jgi:hypothetical protein
MRDALAREAIAAAIDRLLAVLDVIDGDADLEPSLGGSGNSDDREIDGDEADHSNCDDEGLQGSFRLVEECVASSYSSRPPRGFTSSAALKTRRAIHRQIKRVVVRRG